MEPTTYTYPDGYETHMLVKKAIEPIGKIFIFHGMLEHHARYIELTQYLTKNGFDVYVPDLRGAGAKSDSYGTYGHLTPNEGFNRVIEDAVALIRSVDDTLPTFVLGHSFGSLVARRLGQVLGHELAGVIAVAPPPHAGLAGRIGQLAIKQTLKSKGDDYRSRFFERLLFGRYNLKFRHARTDSDWLSSVPEEVDAYANDLYCGGLPTLGFLYEVTGASLDVTRTERIHEHPKSLPLLLLYGNDDPVVQDGEGITGIRNRYEAAQIDVTSYAYENARHEILRERQRDQVWSDLTAWMTRIIQPIND